MARHQLLSLLMLAVFVVVLVIVLRSVTVEPQAPAAITAPPPSASAAAPGAANNTTPPASTNPIVLDGTRPAAPSTIRRVSLDGQDIADALNLRMWKFRFDLPQGEYTNYVWLERWTRDAAAPEVTLLSSISGTWDGNELIVQLPTDNRPQQFVRLGNGMARSAATGQSATLPSPFTMDVLESESLSPGEDVYLVTYTHDMDDQLVTAGRRNVHRNHDQTLYLKTRFVTGSFVPFEPPASTPSTSAAPEPPAAPAPPPAVEATATVPPASPTPSPASGAITPTPPATTTPPAAPTRSAPPPAPPVPSPTPRTPAPSPAPAPGTP